MLKKQEKIDITTGSLEKILGMMSKWKSPGLDLVQVFWLRNFSSLHERVMLQLEEFLDSGFVPSCLTRGRTSLLQKDKSKGNVGSNYRPITCLPLMWKFDRCNCRSDICTFRSRVVVTREAKRVQESFQRNQRFTLYQQGSS